MSKIKNGGLDQYGTEPFEQQQFGTAGGEKVNDGFFSASGSRSILTARSNAERCISYSISIHLFVCP